MRRAIHRRWPLVLLLASVLLSSCGPRGALAGIKQDYPGADEYLAWRNYVLVRFPPDADGVQRAVLLKRDSGTWKTLGEDHEGFVSGVVVIGLIPEMDESGVRALKLR
jgi:hypothetical protein